MTKLQQILENLPIQALITAQHLREKGVSRQLAQSYVDSGWLERLHAGVYKRKNAKPSWQGALYSMQKQLGLPIHVAGETALVLHGIFHHVTIGEDSEPIFLEGPPKTSVPFWFRHLFRHRLHFRTSSVLPTSLGLEPKSMREEFDIVASRPERALLEVLAQVADDHRFDDAANLTDSFRTWDMDLLMNLLTSCRSYKAKRLLMFFGDYHEIKPLIHIVDQVDLGKGKIQIVTGGKYIAKYQITVPHSYSGQNEENPF